MNPVRTRRKGEGVIKDYAEAVKWYRKAADQGYGDARYNLGLKYGNGVLKDPVLAHMCWNIAASIGIRQLEKNEMVLQKQ